MSTYQDEVTARQNAERTLLRATLEGIAGELDGWRVEYPHDHGGQLVNSDGVRIWARLDTGSYVLPDRWKVSLSVGMPDGASYSAGDYGRDPVPSINVSPHRPASTLARDVARRLLPAAVEFSRAVSDRMARRLAAESARETFARELAAIMGGTAHEYRDGWRADVPMIDRVVDGERRTVYGEITPDYAGDSARAELRGLSAEQARELAGLVAGWRK